MAFLDAAEKFLRAQGKRKFRNRLGRFCEAALRVREAMRSSRPLEDASKSMSDLGAPLTIDQTASDDRAREANGEEFSTVVVFAEFKVEATRLDGTRAANWRATTTHQVTGLQSEYCIHEGRIHHVQFQSPPPWRHSTPFVVGPRVKRIMASEKRAIFIALEQLSMSPKRYTYYKTDSFEVWGKEYQDASGVTTWSLRVFSDQDRRIETYDTVTPENLPTCRRTGETEAMLDAMAAWTVSPREATGQH
jgi:hypothetical protein